MPKDAIEISDDIEEYDVNLANLNSNILSNEYVKISQENNPKAEKSYVEMLETKIREQAQRLIELQTYKSLCETKIRQVVPNHPLPINEQHIKKPQNDTMKNVENQERENNLRNQISELKSLLTNKDKVRNF